MKDKFKSIADLPITKDWSKIQEEAYDECMDKLVNDGSPITAFIEWLQENYPEGVVIIKNYEK